MNADWLTCIRSTVQFGLAGLALLMSPGLTLWLRLADAPELTERFGAAYLDYRRCTPAFPPWLEAMRRFNTFPLKGF